MIVVVTSAETQRCQRNTGLAFFFDQVPERFEAGRADIEITIGRQQHAVDTALDERLLRQRVGETDARRTIGGSACAERIQRSNDPALLRTRHRFEHDTRGASVNNDGNTVLRAQLARQQLQRGFQQPDLVVRSH